MTIRNGIAIFSCSAPIFGFFRSFNGCGHGLKATLQLRNACSLVNTSVSIRFPRSAGGRFHHVVSELVETAQEHLQQQSQHEPSGDRVVISGDRVVTGL